MKTCKEIALEIKMDIKKEVDELVRLGFRKPNLTVIQIGNNPASNTYVRGKIKDCEEVGFSSALLKIESIDNSELITIIEKLNNDKLVDGILVQLPLPSNLDEQTIINSIVPEKDVDGFSDLNMGKLFKHSVSKGNESLYPCTPLGIVRLLQELGLNDLSGKEVVILGRSNIVGKPIAKMLLDMNATVTICHSKTNGIDKKLKDADIIVSAIGKPKFINNKESIKQGAIIIDVGINRDENEKLCGDIDFNALIDKCNYISPVPGGVGLLTRAMLLKNTLTAFKNSIS